MKEYTYTAIRDFLQEYKITIKAKNEEEADNIIHSLRYNYNHEWTEVGDLIPDDKLVDIELINERASKQKG
tara:strand:+ start:94 stop:306 length:213 start_codon:yes stop_codon:yes gene_type:complete